MRGSKRIEWGTPKYVQLRLRQHQPHVAPKRVKGYCVRLKSAHRFTLVEESSFSLFGPVTLVYEYECTACKKKKTIYKEVEEER